MQRTTQQSTPPNSSPVRSCRRDWGRQPVEGSTISPKLGPQATLHLGTNVGTCNSRLHPPAHDCCQPVTPTKLSADEVSDLGRHGMETPEDTPAGGGSAPEPPSSPLSASLAPVRPQSPNQRDLLDHAPGTKERRPPSITPRKFRKFFTPRVLPESPITRSVLHDITTHASLNRSKLSSEISGEMFPGAPRVGGKRAAASGDDNDTAKDFRQPKRRNPPRGGAAGLLASPIPLTSPTAPTSAGDTVPPMQAPSAQPLCSPVRRISLERRGPAAQLLQREFGDIDSSFSALNLKRPVLDWRSQTADFCSTKTQAYSFSERRANIFAHASFNRSDKVLIADELGGITLLDVADKPIKCGEWTAHENAVIDVAISADDRRIATASADKRGIVWDTTTNQRLAVLPCDTSTMRTIRFQPGSQGGGGSVLGTSSRNGMVHVWDLRCSSNRTTSDDGTSCPLASPVVQFFSSPPPRGGGNPSQVTALEFLPHGKEHLVLTACDVSAGLKLWDIRAVRHDANNAGRALSFVEAPPGHAATRDWGITSLGLSGDGSRVYSVCRDQTVYAYSTAHLVMGVAPELNDGTSVRPRRSRNAPVHRGLAPLYGFRHPLFTVPTFFVRCAVRVTSAHAGPELLAVGSGHGTPVLFPTDEAFLASQLSVAVQMRLEAEAAAGADADQTFSHCVGLRGSGRETRTTVTGHWGFAASTGHVAPRHPAHTTPIFTSGTPLIHAHAKEATSMSWTPSGRLVSASDDLKVRLWVQDRDAARGLRRDGWSGGQRWGCGWASVEEDYDEPEEW